MPEQWISVRNWRRFQHYDPSKRTPPWIKSYTDLLDDEEAYLRLTGHRRAVLHGIWLAYATTRSRLGHDTATLSARLQLKVSRADLEALNHAGFIYPVASKSLAEGYQSASLEVEVEVETHPNPPTGRGQDLVKKIVSSIANLGSCETAVEAHNRLEQTFLAAGYEVEREARVPNRGDGRAGRVDLLISNGSGKVGIEIDWQTPRQKSIEKLRSVEGGRVIVLREGTAGSLPQGIDAIVSLGPKRSALKRAEQMIRNGGYAYDEQALLNELDGLGVMDVGERHRLVDLAHELSLPLQKMKPLQEVKRGQL